MVGTEGPRTDAHLTMSNLCLIRAWPRISDAALRCHVCTLAGINRKPGGLPRTPMRMSVQLTLAGIAQGADSIQIVRASVMGSCEDAARQLDIRPDVRSRHLSFI